MPQPVGLRVSGVSAVSIDGFSYMLVDGLSWSAASVSRETMSGLDGVHGYKEMPVSGFVSFRIRDIGVRVENFNRMVGSTVVAELASGKQVVLSNGWCVSALEVDGAEGTVEVRFEGPDVVELGV